MIDREEVERIAALAALRLADDEIGRLADDCIAILEYFESIGRLDLSEEAPAQPREPSSPTRDDLADSDALKLSPEEMAPAWCEGYYMLPRLPAMDPNEA